LESIWSQFIFFGNVQDAVCGITSGVKRSDNTSHAGACYVVNSQPGGIDGLQNTDMSQALGSAATQCETDFRSFIRMGK